MTVKEARRRVIEIARIVERLEAGRPYIRRRMQHIKAVAKFGRTIEAIRVLEPLRRVIRRADLETFRRGDKRADKWLIQSLKEINEAESLFLSVLVFLDNRN